MGQVLKRCLDAIQAPPQCIVSDGNMVTITNISEAQLRAGIELLEPYSLRETLRYLIADVLVSRPQGCQTVAQLFDLISIDELLVSSDLRGTSRWHLESWSLSRTTVFRKNGKYTIIHASATASVDSWRLSLVSRSTVLQHCQQRAEDRVHNRIAQQLHAALPTISQRPALPQVCTFRSTGKVEYPTKHGQIIEIIFQELNGLHRSIGIALIVV